jgi:hypothetical protein
MAALGRDSPILPRSAASSGKPHTLFQSIPDDCQTSGETAISILLMWDARGGTANYLHGGPLPGSVGLFGRSSVLPLRDDDAARHR